jgi:hypothetical protein
MLLARIYEVFPLVCPRCGTEMRVIAIITDGPTVRDMKELNIGVRSLLVVVLLCPMAGMTETIPLWFQMRPVAPAAGESIVLILSRDRLLPPPTSRVYVSDVRDATGNTIAIDGRFQAPPPYSSSVATNFLFKLPAGTIKVRYYDSPQPKPDHRRQTPLRRSL